MRRREDIAPEVAQLRMRMIHAGVQTTYLACTAIAAWLWLTWSRPHRSFMVVLLAVALVITFGISRLPREAIVYSRWREPFFLAWSLADMSVIALFAGADGGTHSPTLLVLFVTLVFAALSYPLCSVAIVAGFSLVLAVALAALSPSPDAGYVVMFIACLALTGLLCLWQAMLHQRQRSELAWLMRADHLTGCLNRRGLEERLDAELRRAAFDGAPVGLVQLDLDNFKLVNDEHGHHAGDELLCWAVIAARGALRPRDALGRLGGDEFAAVLPGADEAESERVAARLREALADRVGASAGSASFPMNAHDLEGLLRVADARLYDDKRARRVSVHARVA
jgi:diguanylate cyclase (GGDEF)-like protein